MNRILTTVLMLCLAACNRGASGGDPDMGTGPDPSKPCRGCNLTPETPDMAVPPCGDVGQVCCSNGDGLSCNDGLVCMDNATCQVPVDMAGPSCGAEGSVCFSDNSLSCCDGLACVTADSAQGTCQNPPPPCGALGEACCSGDVPCNDGLVCTDATCQIPTPPPCGDVDQACCQPDNTCQDGLACSDDGKCVSDVPECVHPHGKGHAYGWYLHHCRTKVFKNDMGNKP